MQRLIVLALIGFAAQLVDGSLGMGYGVTATSLLLTFGIAPAVASASVHMAEVVTNAASGYSHYRFGNVDWTIVRRLIIPGSIGAFIGACFLSNLPGDMVKPYISEFLFILGVYVFIRFLIGGGQRKRNLPRPRKRFLTPVGLVAGFADAIGGAGWGPITTPLLLSRKGMEPRKVVGSVDTSEFAISVSATLGFLISLGWNQVSWTWVAALMIGGIMAASIAAWLVRIIPTAILGVLVGGIIMFTNAKTLISSFHIVPESATGMTYTGLIVLWAAGIALALRNVQKGRIKNKKEGSAHHLGERGDE